MDWRHDAVCRDEDPELFFPVGNSGPALLQIAEAKAVCRRCPVASECLAWALESGQDAGDGDDTGFSLHREDLLSKNSIANELCKSAIPYHSLGAL